MEEKFFEELREKIQPFFEKGGSHAFNHTQRVYNLAVRIAEEEKADLEIIKAAALLHDIARKDQESNYEMRHAKEGAKKGKKNLKRYGFSRRKN